MTSTIRPATPRQLAYLRALALGTGQTFTPPRTNQQASREISRLQSVKTTGFTFAELDAEHASRQRTDDVPLYAPGVREDEIAGYGSNARWSR